MCPLRTEIARAISRRYHPQHEGDAFAWYWHPVNDGTEEAVEFRAEDLALADYVLALPALTPSAEQGEAAMLHAACTQWEKEADRDAARARELEAEAISLRASVARLTAERDRLREREADIARLLQIADGGQYRADWEAPIKRLVVERDRLREALPIIQAVAAIQFGPDDPPWPDDTALVVRLNNGSPSPLTVGLVRAARALQGGPDAS